MFSDSDISSTESFESEEYDSRAYFDEFGNSPAHKKVRNLEKDSNQANLSRKESGDNSSILCFGYGARLFQIEKQVSLKLESGSLCPWPFADGSSNILIDRNLITEKGFFDQRIKPIIHSAPEFFNEILESGFRKNHIKSRNKHKKLLKLLNNSRFGDLYADDSQNESENDLLSSSSNDASKKRKYGLVGLDYSSLDKPKSTENKLLATEIVSNKSISTDDSGISNQISTEEAFKLPFKPPEGIKAPSSRKQFDIIEKTASYIAEKPTQSERNTLELTIQARQSTNSLFSFLNKSNVLYPFYRHVLFLFLSGLYGYDSDSSSDIESVSKTTINSDSMESERHMNKVESKKEKSIESEAQSEHSRVQTPSQSSNEFINESTDMTPLTRRVSSSSEKNSKGLEVAPIDSKVLIPKNMRVPSDKELVNMIVNTAKFIVYSQREFSKAEADLRIQKASTPTLYSFLSAMNEYNSFYTFYRDSISKGKTVIFDTVQSSESYHLSLSENPSQNISKTEIVTKQDDSFDYSTETISGNPMKVSEESDMKSYRRKKLATFLANKNQNSGKT
ncbi:hypothetical protein BB560_000111 [Smittium megazygosporum]|uniref:SURP motif domain-containing protein n=1 Tax=Smittium megazygosporum TaxID=133381 RepID=A0A2T9ZLC2_9FUNG|nr:hypothetical protein BB560_000111 [Smittium megazygosporum]